MDLLSYFKRKDQGRSPAATPVDPDALRAARTRARRRLVGAIVLLGVGVVAFPVLFETQPRPIPIDLPIDIPRRENLPPLERPAPTRATGTVTAQAPEPAPALVTAQPPAGAALVPGDEGAPAVAPPSAPARATVPVRETPSAASAAGPAGAVKPAPPASTPSPAPTSAAASAAVPGRWVVQVGAFAEVEKAREVRLKVERLGLKTYTQVVQTADGRRIRVRVGPYDSKPDAERAAERIKGGGLPTAVLVL